MAIAEVRDLVKHYHMGDVAVAALAGISIRFEEGDYCAIMGHSGSGKSTLLNLLGCLDQPTSGHYWLGGVDVSELSDDELSEIRSQRLGFIFQSYNLIAQLTVLENIEVPLFYQGWAARDSRERAIELAEMVGLAERMDHRPSELSGGQQQRVAIARALANDPFIVLADEPTGNLDPGTEQEILTILEGLNCRGTTLIVVTHEPEIARTAHRVVTLQDGRVVSDARSVARDP